jgi:lipopolysaccharide biosynthesis regulator YciM
MRLARLLVAGSALVLCAWFALGIRQAHDTTAATAIINQNANVSAVAAAHAGSLLDRAATLNPAVQITILRSQLALRRNEYRRAIAIARQATRQEPSNVATWLAVAVASYDSGGVDYQAVGKMAVLDPQLSHPKR